MVGVGRVSQVAISVRDLDRSCRFYRDVLGFLPAGGERIRGRLASRVMGLRDVDARCRWLVGRDERVQLEIFQFSRPAPNESGADADALGWRRVGLHVEDLEGALARAAVGAGEPPAAPVGAPGARTVSIRDPDGVHLDLMEADPEAGRSPAHRGARVAVRSVALGVSDVERARSFFVDGLGLADGPARLGTGPVRIELVACGPTASRDVRRLQDYGLLNVALGFRHRSEFRDCVQRLRDRGYHLVSAPLDAGLFSVVYCAGPEGVSVELLYVHRWFERFTGYVPRPRKERS